MWLKWKLSLLLQSVDCLLEHFSLHGLHHRLSKTRKLRMDYHQSVIKECFYLLCADDKKGKMASLLPSHKIKTTSLSLWAFQPFFKNTTRSPFYAWGCSQRVSRKRRPKTKDLEKEDYRKQSPRKRPKT